MRTLASLVLLCLLPSCVTWAGQGKGVSDSDRAKGLRDVASLAKEQEAREYYRSLRQRRDGLTNALGRDLDNITAFIDRHFFNYSKDDPYVNFPTESTRLEHVFGFALDTTVATPLWWAGGPFTPEDQLKTGR